MVEKTKVFVTGAPGWLGTKLVEELIKSKKEVRCFVLKGVDASHLRKIGADIVEGDLTNEFMIKEELFKDIKTIFHCAGIIHPKLFRAKDFIKVNRDSTQNLLRIAVKAGVKRFIYISSNAAAGFNNSRNFLMKESDFPQPYTAYGKSKWEAEKIVREHQERGQIETVIIRPCWFYGPGQPERMTKLMKMIKSSKPFMFGNGDYLRSMTYVKDLVDALLLVESNEKANGQTYWIADEKPYTIKEIYGTIGKLLGVKEINPRKIPGFLSRVLEFGDKTASYFGIYEINSHVGGEMSRNIAVSIEKAKRDLGWKPKHGALEEGMKYSIDWAKEHNLLD